MLVVKIILLSYPHLTALPASYPSQGMVIPEEREGKTDVATELLRDSSKPTDIISSRKAGGRDQEKPIQKKVSNVDF